MDVDSTPDRQGMTIIELVVALAIIALLASLLMPAVQSSRTTARRLQCISKLKQLTLGVINYEGVYGSVPIFFSRQYGDTSYERSGFFFSLFPFIGIENSREARRIPLLTCPADSPVSSARSGLSYVVNAGPIMAERQVHELNGIVHWPAYFNGDRDFVSFSDISDGLSSTACLSEQLSTLINPSSAADANPAIRYSWQVNVPIGITPSMAEIENYVQHCEAGPTILYPLRLGGAHDWPSSDGNLDSLYAHAMRPNTPLCESTLGGIRIWGGPATSAHPSGVNLSLMDGSCRFINEAIDRDVWRALGTRDGNDKPQ